MAVQLLYLHWQEKYIYIYIKKVGDGSIANTFLILFLFFFLPFFVLARHSYFKTDRQNRNAKHRTYVYVRT